MTRRTRLLVSTVASALPGVAIATAAFAQGAAGQPAVLPPEITKQLDARFPRWTIAPASDDSMAAWRSGSRHMPNVERGDYDGNGQPDYVLAITYPVGAGRSTRHPRVDVVLFLRRGEAYRFMSVGTDIGLPLEIAAKVKGERIQEYGEDTPSCSRGMPSCCRRVTPVRATPTSTVAAVSSPIGPVTEHRGPGPS